jgi:hypothetical protein
VPSPSGKDHCRHHEPRGQTAQAELLRVHSLSSV